MTIKELGSTNLLANKGYAKPFDTNWRKDTSFTETLLRLAQMMQLF